MEYDTEVPSPKSTWRLVDNESPYRKKRKKKKTEEKSRYILWFYETVRII